MSYLLSIASQPATVGAMIGGFVGALGAAAFGLLKPVRDHETRIGRLERLLRIPPRVVADLKGR